MERAMACGMGACLGCAVKMKNGGYKMACSNGPVFDSKEIEW
jgi:dihydroorotate dehydrogenase electron transfer subunit